MTTLLSDLEAFLWLQDAPPLPDIRPAVGQVIQAILLNISGILAFWALCLLAGVLTWR